MYGEVGRLSVVRNLSTLAAECQEERPGPDDPQAPRPCGIAALMALVMVFTSVVAAVFLTLAFCGIARGAPAPAPKAPPPLRRATLIGTWTARWGGAGYRTTLAAGGDYTASDAWATWRGSWRLAADGRLYLIESTTPGDATSWIVYRVKLDPRTLAGPLERWNDAAGWVVSGGVTFALERIKESPKKKAPIKPCQYIARDRAPSGAPSASYRSRKAISIAPAHRKPNLRQGYCCWAAAETAGLHLGIAGVAGLRDDEYRLRRGAAGGAWPADVARRLAWRGVRAEWRPEGSYDRAWVRAHLAAGRPVAVVVRSHGATGAADHCVTVVGYGDGRACWVDPNATGRVICGPVAAFNATYWSGGGVAPVP